MSVLIMGLLLLAPTGQPPQGAVLVDGVAAVVGREVITRSDVERACRLALVRRGGVAGAAGGRVDDGLRKAVLNVLIVEELVLLDARRRQKAPETDEDVAQRAASLKEGFPSEDVFRAFLAAVGIPEQDFLELMRRQARVDRLMAEKAEAAVPDDKEADAYLKAHPELHSDAPGVARTRAKAAILQDRSQRAASDYIQRLREQTPVNVVARYDAPPTSPAP